jgi:predicted DNA-binding protein
MNYIMRTIYLDKKTIAELRSLSKRTRIPQAVFMREAVDLLLNKYEKQLSNRQKRVKTQDHQMDKRKRLKMVPKLKKVKKGSR